MLHIEPLLQVPQLSTAAQPSDAVPHSKPSEAQLRGVQVPVPQTLGVPPPPQVWPLLQVPQVSVPPQPSETLPQVAPSAEQLFGEQVTGVKHAPARHDWPRRHALHRPPPAPHSSVLPPPTHWPSAVQQPWQFDESHVLAAGPQAVTRSSTAASAREIRMAPQPATRARSAKEHQSFDSHRRMSAKLKRKVASAAKTTRPSATITTIAARARRSSACWGTAAASPNWADSSSVIQRSRS